MSAGGVEGDAPVGRGRLFATGPIRVPAARLGVAVVRELVAGIVSGDVAAGDPLPPEAVLADRFAVSRTVIRESVKRIEEKGLVTVAQGRGTHVLPAGSWNVLDPVVLDAMVANDDSLGVLDELSVVRSSLESAMSAEVARTRSSEDVIALEAALDRMRETVDDEQAFGQADVDFHFLIAEQSGNRLAENITRILFQRARESARFSANGSPEAFRLTLEGARARLRRNPTRRCRRGRDGHADPHPRRLAASAPADAPRALTGSRVRERPRQLPGPSRCSRVNQRAA